MSELKPCKCKLCDSEFVPAGAIGEAWKNPRNGCNLSNVYFGNNELDKIRALMDDTPDLLRGARIGLEMAAKYHDAQSAEWLEYARRAELEYDEEDGEDDDAALRASACREHAGQHLNDALKLRAITDTDIMKEISRE